MNKAGKNELLLVNSFLSLNILKQRPPLIHRTIFQTEEKKKS